MMQTSDLDKVNAVWELLGGVLLWGNVASLYRDKEVKGVNPLINLFFFFWGTWNLYYYHQMNQHLSFAGQLVMVSGYLTWLLLLGYYKYGGKVLLGAHKLCKLEGRVQISVSPLPKSNNYTTVKNNYDGIESTNIHQKNVSLPAGRMGGIVQRFL